ncbi:hypothetical protein DRE_03220 [Drechslerella stenobrocha 248]|uniref:Glutamyl-tRNA amidotransferase complex subunit Gta3 domain-containing protein n=1 Tax=Drechslerella stenobrocha 248 TaxID=1043628 RepID=W7IEZ0_9PEZI|nr:hypothetical protein DRE_03220 [Drechslerella stenobrocha 248]
MRRSAVRLLSRSQLHLEGAKGAKGPRRPGPSKESLAAVQAMLAKPTWSITSLLPPSHPRSTAAPLSSPDVEITPAKLEHLLRLSALPMPKDKDEEARLIRDLIDQLYFVGKVREVDVTGVEPLVAIRDENSEKAVTLEDIEEAEKKLKEMGPMGDEEWDPLREAKGTVGRYFVVEGEMGEGSGEEETKTTDDEGYKQ